MRVKKGARFCRVFCGVSHALIKRTGGNAKKRKRRNSGPNIEAMPRPPNTQSVKTNKKPHKWRISCGPPRVADCPASAPDKGAVKGRSNELARSGARCSQVPGGTTTVWQ